MTYHIDDKNLSLSELKQRIECTDLVPSRDCLKKSLEPIFKALVEYGIQNTAELRQIFKNNKKKEALSQGTGISSDLLTLLRREIEGYFPRPFSLSQFNWLPDEDIQYFISKSIKDTADLFHAVEDGLFDEMKSEKGTVISAGMLALAKMCDLTRIQWVSPATARMILEAGYDSSRNVAEAEPEVLCDRLALVNKDGRYFNGKIGLRDVKRLVSAAAYLPG